MFFTEPESKFSKKCVHSGFPGK